MKYLSTQPTKGTRDFLPEEMSIRQQIFGKLFATAELFGFRRYDGPILESAEIYEAKSGEEIVNQQMYSLVDKGGRTLALRPEMTPSVARIVAGNQDRITLPARWYSHVNCHRYERPQRGRVREHWQLNVDIFGTESLSAELEIFELIEALMGSIGATPDMYVLRVNDRTLVDAALDRFVGLDTELRGPASKLIDRWEKITEDARSEAIAEIGLSAAQGEKLRELVRLEIDDYCDAAGEAVAAQSSIARIIREEMTPVRLKFDPLIVRGFDYYTSTVFEVFDLSPENRRSLFGGGRYDDLASLFTSRRIPGIGFGMGDVTTWHFLENRGLLPKPNLPPDIFVFGTDPDYRSIVHRIARSLRGEQWRTEPALEPLSIRNGMKLADRLQAKKVVFVADGERAQGAVSVKDMASGLQVTVAEAALLDHLRKESE